MRWLALLLLGALAVGAEAQPVAAPAASPPDSVHTRTPRGAVTRALLAPGLGQVYNGQTIKAPIVAALVVGSVVYAVDRQRQYLRFRRATVFAGCLPEDQGGQPGDPVTSPDRFALCSEVAPDYEDEWEAVGEPQFGTTLTRTRDQARSQRDIGFLAVGVVYAFQALDAYVAAELADFDVSEDLTVRVTPSVHGGTLAIRLRL